MNAENVLSGIELAVIKPEQIQGDLNDGQKSMVAGVVQRAFNVYYQAHRSADGLTGAATDMIKKKKLPDSLGRKVYDNALDMSAEIRKDLKECAEKRSGFGGESFATFVRALDQPAKWAFKHTPTPNQTGGTFTSAWQMGSYGSTWDSGNDIGEQTKLACPVPMGIAVFLRQMSDRGMEGYRQCPGGEAFWNSYLRQVKQLKQTEDWEHLGDKIEWGGKVAKWICPKLWAAMKVEEEQGEKYMELLESGVELLTHTKEYMDKYNENRHWYTSYQSQTAPKQACLAAAKLLEEVLSGSPPLSFGFGKLYATVINGMPGLMDFFRRYGSYSRDPFAAAAMYR